MLQTKQKRRKQINDLKKDFEVINPIESKKVLGGSYGDPHSWDGTQWQGAGGWAWGPNNTGGWSPENGWGNPYGDNWGQDGNNGNDNGGGGGDDEVYHVLPNLPAMVYQQVPGSGGCVSYAMTFAAQYLGASVNHHQIQTINATNLGVGSTTIILDGLDLAQTNQAIHSFFNANTLQSHSQILTALNNNHAVIVGQNFGTYGHALCIVGFNEVTGQYLAADSNTGTYTYIYGNEFDFNLGAFEIVSVK